jgi:hypothetical protein
LAVLQLLSKAEIDTDLCIDSERKRLLEKRIKTGPLDANHLRAVRSLRIFGTLGRGRGGETRADSPMLNETVAITESGSMSAVNREHRSGAAAKQQEASEICSSDLVFLTSNGVIIQDHNAPFFVDNIFGLEIKPSLQNREEQSALQLVELRAKTANIRRSLPDWVRNGLMPPRHNPSPSANMLSDRFHKDTHRDAVQISCEVRADLGFFMASDQPSLQPAGSNPVPDLESCGVRADLGFPGLMDSEQPSLPPVGSNPLSDLERIFLDVRVNGDIVAEEISSKTEWQEATVYLESLTLRDRPSSNPWLSLTWISNTLQHLSLRLLGLLDACCKCTPVSWLAGPSRQAET